MKDEGEKRRRGEEETGRRGELTLRGSSFITSLFKSIAEREKEIPR